MNALLRTLSPICVGAALLASACANEGDIMGGGDLDADAGSDDQNGDGDGDDSSNMTDGEEEGDPDICDVESPYMGGWDIGCCQDDQTVSAWAPGSVGVGTVIPDWTFTDQFGEMVRLYDFCHEAIYFEYVAFW